MPIYDYEYNGKIYSFESDEQPNEQEVMDFITSYKEPEPAVKETPQVEQPVLQGGVKKVSEQNPYADIVNNPDLTPEQMAEQIQARGEQERRDLDWELAKYKTKSRTGLGLQTAASLPGVNLLLGGALFGAGQAMIEDKDLPDILKAAGLYGAGAKVSELGFRGLGRLAQTKPAQAAFEAIAQSPVGKKAKEVGEKIASSKPVKNVSEFLLKPRGVAKAAEEVAEKAVPQEVNQLKLNLEQPKTVAENVAPQAVAKSGKTKTSQLGQSGFVKETFGHSIDKDYEVLTNKELIDAASENVAKDAETIKSNLMARGANEKSEFSALDFEQGRQLLEKLYAEGRDKEAADLTEVLTQKGTQAGQAVQAMSLWSKTTPEGAEVFAQRIIDKYNKTHPKKPIKLTSKQRKKIRELAANIQKTSEGYERQFATAVMLKEISDLVPKSFADKFKVTRNISLLLNAKTFMRNISGNVILGTAENVITKPLAAGIDKAVSLVTGKRSRVTTQGMEYLKGLLEGFKKGHKEVMAGVNTRNLGGRFDLPQTRVFEAPVLKQLEIATDWSLRVPDSAFYEATFQESLINQIKTAMINKGEKGKITPEIIEKYTNSKMVKQATEEALEAVYQNNGAVSNFVTGVRKAARLGKDFGVGDVLIPYAQTPANIAEMGANYSPIGLGKGIFNLAKGNQRQGTLDIARGLVGTGLGYGGYELAKNGLINPMIENAREKANKELLGIRPNTLQLGDNYYSYTQLQPLASALSAGAAIAGKATPIEAIDSYLDTVLDTSMMQGLRQMAEDKERYGTTTAVANALLGLPSQLVPTLVNQANAYIDPIQRETYDPNPMKRTLNYIEAKVPGLSKNLPAKYNLKGEEKQKYERKGAEKAWDVFANPIFKNKPKDDIVVQELFALKDNTGENVLLPIANKKVPKLDNYKLSGEQYSKYQKVLGEKIYEGLDNLINDPQYVNSDDATRADLVQQRQKMIKSFVDEKLFGVENQYKKQVTDPAKKVENKIKRFNRKIDKLKTLKLLYNDLGILDIEQMDDIIDLEE